MVLIRVMLLSGMLICEILLNVRRYDPENQANNRRIRMLSLWSPVDSEEEGSSNYLSKMQKSLLGQTQEEQMRNLSSIFRRLVQEPAGRIARRDEIREFLKTGHLQLRVNGRQYPVSDATIKLVRGQIKATFMFTRGDHIDILTTALPEDVLREVGDFIERRKEMSSKILIVEKDSQTGGITSRINSSLDPKDKRYI